MWFSLSERYLHLNPAALTATSNPQSALDLEGGHADALALMSQLHMERRDYEAAGRVRGAMGAGAGSRGRMSEAEGARVEGFGGEA